MYNLLLKRFFSFKGRTGKKEYIIKIIFSFCIYFFWPYLYKWKTSFDIEFQAIITGIYVLLMLISLIQYFPLSVRRLHDINESGWYSLLTFVPISQFFILYLMFKKGTPGPNKYGEPPTY